MRTFNGLLSAAVPWFAFLVLCQFALDSLAAGADQPLVPSFNSVAKTAQLSNQRRQSPTRLEAGSAATSETVEMYLIIREAEDFYAFSNPLSAAIRKLDLSGVRFSYLGCGYWASAPVLPGPVATIPPLTKAVHVKVSAADVPKVVAASGVKTTSTRARFTEGVYTNRPELCRHELPRAFDRSYRVAIWAAAVYPEFFPAPFPDSGTTADGFEYFIYGSVNHVGVKDGRVYIHNGFSWKYLDVGAVSDFIPASLDETSAR